MAADTLRDLALDEEGQGDITLAVGDLVLTSGLTGLRQSIAIRQRFFRGEWFLNLLAGIPYYQDVLIKNPDPGVLRSVFRADLLDTPGVLDVISLRLTRDAAARELNVQWRVSSDFGELGSEIT